MGGGGRSGRIWGDKELEKTIEERSLEILELKAVKKALGRSEGGIEEGRAEDGVQPRRRLRDFQI